LAAVFLAGFFLAGMVASLGMRGGWKHQSFATSSWIRMGWLLGSGGGVGSVAREPGSAGSSDRWGSGAGRIRRRPDGSRRRNAQLTSSWRSS
jgi:hypothetical protein